MLLPRLPDDELEVLCAKQRGTPVTTTEAKDRLSVALTEALQTGENTLITAPTSLGKTYTVATTPWRDYPEITGGQPVIHISQTTDARNQAAEASEEAGVEYHVLRARTDLCPVAGGDYDNEFRAPGWMKPSEWFNQKCDRDGASFGDAHGHLAKINGGLPCSRENRCPAFSQYQNVPRNEDNEPTYDVIHASAAFARLVDITANCNVIFDERPTYRVDIDKDRVRDALTNLFSLRTDSDDGTYTWESFIQLVKSRPEGGDRDGLAEWHREMATYEELFTGGLGGGERFDSRASIHELAPAIARAISSATPVRNGRYCGRSGRLTVVFDEKNRVRVVHDAPDLSYARCVIGLDAHPSPLLWKLNTVPGLRLHSLLTDAENQYWRTVERGLYVVQIGHYTRPLTKGWRNNSQPAEVELLIESLRAKFGSEFRTCICPRELTADVESRMLAAGIPDPESMHYGGEKSRNNFGDESVGLLIGCIDPGDEMVLDNLALLGLHAETETVVDEEGDEKRAYGRGFVGPDADAAAEFLESVRETHVAQSIGRYARNAEKTGVGGVVYVWTNAIPAGMVDEQVSGVVSRAAPKKDAIAAYLCEQDEPVTYRTVAEAVDTRKKHVWESCQKLEAKGAVRISRGTGKNGADEVVSLSKVPAEGPRVGLTIRAA